ncbi:2-oxoacid ferredoxin oxidoreductase, partial [Candidatus Heimdallarchaeota archaeon]
MKTEDFDIPDADIAWCPGCGNFSILRTLKTTFADLKMNPHEIVIVSGIGQAAKSPHYIKANFFNGLHGRALPVAFAIKAVNPELTVIAESGDGCMYGEGGNHFLHAIRRNIDITMIAHNNMIYGLTKGQASPTTQRDFETGVQTHGVILEPFNPLAVAIAQNASFVARGNSADRDELQKILTAAIQHKGFALVDIFQPCVSFNKKNT